MKCAANDDIVTIQADDNADALKLIFESPSMPLNEKWFQTLFKYNMHSS